MSQHTPAELQRAAPQTTGRSLHSLSSDVNVLGTGVLVWEGVDGGFLTPPILNIRPPRDPEMSLSGTRVATKTCQNCAGKTILEVQKHEKQPECAQRCGGSTIHGTVAGRQCRLQSQATLRGTESNAASRTQGSAKFQTTQRSR